MEKEKLFYKDLYKDPFIVGLTVIPITILFIILAFFAVFLADWPVIGQLSVFSIIPLILASFFAWLIIRLILKTDDYKFHMFVDFVISAMLPGAILHEFDPDFKYISFENTIVYLVLGSFLATTLIYLKWKTTIFTILINLIRTLIRKINESVSAK